MQTKLRVTGMHCQSCAANVTEALRLVPGVTHVGVDLPSGIAQIDGQASVTALIAAVKQAGFDIKVPGTK